MIIIVKTTKLVWPVSIVGPKTLNEPTPMKIYLLNVKVSKYLKYIILSPVHYADGSGHISVTSTARIIGRAYYHDCHHGLPSRKSKHLFNKPEK